MKRAVAWFATLLLVYGAWNLVRSFVKASEEAEPLPFVATTPTANQTFIRGRFSTIDEAIEQSLDDNQVIYYDYRDPVGKQYNPLFIADFVLDLVPIADNPQAFAIIEANLTFLTQRAKQTANGTLLHPYDFDFDVAQAKAPWYSSMAQARVAQALMWGWRLTDDPEYKQLATQTALALSDDTITPPFALPLATGVWLKEFPGYEKHVLDGSLVALVGLHQVALGLLQEDHEREKIQTLFATGLEGLINHYACFSSPFGGVYFNDRGALPTQAYYQIITTQLAYLEKVDSRVGPIRRQLSFDGMARWELVGFAWWGRVQRWLDRELGVGGCF